MNPAWAATIVVLPFATQLVAQYGIDRGAVAIHIGCLAVSSVLLTAMTHHPARRPQLHRDAAHLNPVRSAGTTVALALAAVLGVAGLNYWALLLTVDQRLTQLLRRWR
jgi:uncharacterized iron-regulated membrane protein